jgi:cytochrome c553
MTRSCPWCKAALPFDERWDHLPARRPPRDNDVTICDQCHGASVMHGEQWCIPTPAEETELMRDKRFLKALAVSIAHAVERAKEKPPN